MRNNLTVFQSEKKSFVERNFGKDFDFQNILRSLFLIFVICLIVTYQYLDINFFKEFMSNLYLNWFESIGVILIFSFFIIFPFYFLSKQKSKIIFTENEVIVQSFFKENSSKQVFSYQSLDKIKFIKNKNFLGFRGVVLQKKNKNNNRTTVLPFALNTNEITNLQYFIEKTPKLKEKIKVS